MEGNCISRTSLARFRRLQRSDSIQQCLKLGYQTLVFWVLMDVVRFFGIIEFIIEFGIAIAPLDVPPAMGSNGLSIVVSATRDQSEGRVAALGRWVLQQRTKTLPSQFVRRI